MPPVEELTPLLLPPHSVDEHVISLFGINIHSASMSQALANIDTAINTRHSLNIGMLNAAKVVNMKRNIDLNDDVVNANLIIADGFGVVMASKILRKALPERVAGIDLMHGILGRGDRRGYRVFLLGASEAVSLQAMQEIRNKYPGVTIVGRRNGYFSIAEQGDVAQQVADANADVLLVAITSPKKEQFMAAWSATMQVPVIHGVGGSFDVLAGKVKRAPKSWQRFGMEWLYRVLQEPDRLWHRYLVTNTLFIGMLAKEIIKPTKSQ